MCGDMNPRSSRGGLIASICPYQETKPTNLPGLVLSFSNAENSHQTHATLTTSDHSSLRILKDTTSFTMRVEKYGDLLRPTDLKKSQPLYSFELRPQHEPGRIEFAFPYKLDFGVSESGIVGRQATLLSSRKGVSEMNVVGKGVIGWN